MKRKCEERSVYLHLIYTNILKRKFFLPKFRDYSKTNTRLFFKLSPKKFKKNFFKGLFLKRAQLNLFGNYAVTKKLHSSERKPARQSNYDDFIRLFVGIRQTEWPWEKRQVGNFAAKNTLDIFPVQTSEVPII
jgi:hypothetical protein